MLKPTELFEGIALASHYGPVFRDILRENPRAMEAAEALLFELTKDSFLSWKLEQAGLPIPNRFSERYPHELDSVESDNAAAIAEMRAELLGE